MPAVPPYSFDDDRELLACLAKLAQQRTEILGLGDDDRRLRERSDRRLGIAASGGDDLLQVNDADKVVERSGADGVARMPVLSGLRQGGVDGEAGVQPVDLGRGHHHVGRLEAGKVEHVVQQLLLGARNHAGTLGLVDERAQLLRRADGVSRDHLAHTERAEQDLCGLLEHPDDGP